MDGEPPVEEDFSLIPLLERCVHKNWKARLSAYTEIIQKAAKTASDNDPFFKPYTSDGALLRKLALDANAVAQEKGIEAVLAIVRESGENSAKTRPEVLPALVDKALGSTRAGTKSKGLELCLMYCEVENAGEGVMLDVLKGLESKQPKVVAGSVACLKEMVVSFGVGTLGNIKPLLKSLAKIFGHTDKTVRAEGTALTQALYTFLGPALNPSIADLKPVQIKELQESFEAMDGEARGAGTGKPIRFTRQQAREREAAEASGAGAGEEEEAEPEAVEIDANAFVDPVDILKLCPPDLLDILGSTKWKEKVEALTAVSEVLIANPKVSDSNADQYAALAQILGKRCQSDSNINVVIAAAQVIDKLARGMGKAFGRHKPVLVPQILERMKERKATVTDALGLALDGIFTTVTLGDVGEDILTAVKSKNPQVKEGTLRFLSRSLCSTTDAPPKDLVKPLAESLITLLGDSFEPVRLAAADCLAALMKILGERAMNPYTEGVAELQMAKVKEALERVEVKYKAGSAAARPKVLATSSAPAARPAVKAPVKSAPPKVVRPAVVDDRPNESAPPKAAPPARLMANVAPKPSTAPPARPAQSKAANSVKAASSSKSLAISPSEPVKYKYSAEDAMTKAVDDIPAAYHTKLADGAWKTRLEAAEELVAWLSDDGANAVESEVLFRFLCKIPGWSEKNFQVSAKLYNAMAVMAEKSPSFGRSSAALVIGPLSDKLGDMKLKKPAGDALVVFAEKTSLAFILAQAYEPMTKQKAPKAQADALTWIKNALVDFGIAGLPLKDLVAFLKTALQSSNGAVRSSATSVLVTLRLFVGTDVVSFLEDLNPQLLTTINSEFDKVAGQAAPEPTRTSADLETAAGPPGSGSAAAAVADPLDDLIPRVDLDKLVASTSVLTDSKSDAWKTRKEAFESLNAVLEVGANARLKPNMGEISSVLKRAMNDTNLAVKMLALGIVSRIALGMGQPMEKHVRILAAPVANVCADQKVGTRTAALACLSAIKDACGLDPLYGGLATSLETPNPLLRSSVLGWLAAELQAAPPSAGADLAPLAAPIISCLEDRNGDVRKGATAILPYVIANAGYDFVVDQTSKLKAASRSTVMAVIQNAKPLGSTVGPTAVAATAPASRSGASTPKVARAAPAPRTATKSTIEAPRQLVKPEPAASRSLAMKALGGRPASRASTEDDDPFARPATKMKPIAKGRPASNVLTHEQQASSSSYQSAPATPTEQSPIFTASDPELKKARAKKDIRWLCDQPARPEHLTHLEGQMEQSGVDHALISLLFSKDHQREKDFEEGLKQMEAFYAVEGEAFGLSEETVKAIQNNNVDLVLKYLAIRLSSNNSILTNKSLDVLARVLGPEATLSQLDCQIILPAVTQKLGDNKFKVKVDEIFGMINNTMPPSLVASQLVLYGFESRNSKTRSESLASYKNLITKRPSFAKACVSDKKLYPALTKLISDAGARDGALTLIATLVQYLGAAAVVKYITPLGTKEQGLLNNRLAATASSQPGPSRSTAVPARTTAATPLRPVRAHVTSAAQIVQSDSPRALPVRSPNAPESSRPSSPAVRSSRFPATSSVPASPSRLPAKTERPSRPVEPAESLPEVSAPARGFATRPLNGFGSRPSMAAGRGSASQEDRAVKSVTNVHLLISDIGKMGPTPTVDVIKKLEYIMKEQPEDMRGHLTPLVVAVIEVMQAAFAHDPRLESDEYYRLVKHAVQVTNEIVHCGVKAGQPGTYGIATSNWSLTEELTDATLLMLFKEFTLRLVNTDDVNRKETKDLSRYINMTVLELLSSCDRLMTYQALFDLMVDLSRNFMVYNIDRESSQARHADLVMKCIWKRADSIVKDLDKGVFTAGELLKVMETLFSVIPPSSWRAMGEQKIALGDMPLRTVKSMIQRIGMHCREDVYDSLAEAFGDADAGQSNVYQYLHKFMEAVKKKDKEAAVKAGQTIGKRSRTPPPPSSSSAPQDSHPVAAVEQSPRVLQETTSRNDLDRDPVLARLEALIQGSVGKELASHLDEIHSILTEHPQYDAQFAALAEANTTQQYGRFLQRGLEQRRNKPDAAVVSQEPPASPEGRPTSAAARIAARRSLGRPVSAMVPPGPIDGDVDARLEHFKGVFSRPRERERSESRSTSLGAEADV